MNLYSKQLTLSALFIALGVLFPILFHGLGLGSIFLPMFWPAAFSGFFLTLPYAVAVGAVTPCVSFLLTGMPPAAPPILHMVVLEMICLTGTTALLFNKTRWGLGWVLLSGLVLSRIVLFFSAKCLALVFGLPWGWISTVSVLQGLPGMIGMLVFIPVAVSRLRQDPVFKVRGADERGA